jgi:hypothetical protein
MSYGVFISNSSFLFNSASGAQSNGGAIYSALDITLSNTTFQGNRIVGVIFSGQRGGALAVGSVSNAKPAVLLNCSFVGNSAGLVGVGGAVSSLGSVNFTDILFVNNTSLDGAAVHVSFNSLSSVLFLRSSFFGNSATSRGGAAYVVDDTNRPSSAIVFTLSTFVNNSATAGGALYLRFGSPRLDRCVSSRNESPDRAEILH